MGSSAFFRPDISMGGRAVSAARYTGESSARASKKNEASALKKAAAFAPKHSAAYPRGPRI